jgi:CubicO group peptidase (beta-lactamase class C family)
LDSIALVYDTTQANKEIDDFMQKLHSRSGFNGNVLVAKKGKIIYQNSFGWADYLHRDSLTITSRFELASVSKPLTGLAVLQLVEQGKLDIDAPVSSFFPGFPYEGVTVRQMLSHRSGLPDYIYFTDNIWEDKKKGMTNDEAIALLVEHKPARFGRPDGRFDYRNTNFMLLASIVEKVSGQDFPTYMQEHIFKPAGMKNTVAMPKIGHDKVPTNVIGHDKVWRRSVVQNFLDGTIGDKGVYSTVQDLYLLDRALREGRILGQAMQDSAYVPRSNPNHGIFSYGYGWRTFSPSNAQIVYHTGWWHGFKNLYVRDLTNDVTIVLLTNFVNNSLNSLDDLYKILEIPILRRNAYDSNGGFVEH